MKKAINLRYDLVKNNDAYLEYVSNAGFDGIDFGIPASKSDEERVEFLKFCETLKKKLEKHNLECSQVHLPYYGLFTSSEITDENVDKNIINAFSAMDILGCKWGAHHPRSSTNFNYDAKRALEDNKRELTMYLEEAVKKNVGIAVENLPVFPDCPQYRFFTADYEDHIELVDSLKSDNIGICWDFGHANLMPYDMKKIIGRIGNRIKIVHVHNNFRTYDLHLVPSMGTIDWDVIMPALLSTGFGGVLSLEINDILTPGANASFYQHCSDVADELCKIK